MTLSQAAKIGLNPAELLEYREVKAKYLPLLIAEAMASLNALIMDKRFVSQKKYAEYYGYHSKAIAKLANTLKKQGIAKGEGRQARYDKTFRPDGTRLEEYQSLPT